MRNYRFYLKVNKVICIKISLESFKAHQLEQKTSKMNNIFKVKAYRLGTMKEPELIKEREIY